MRHDRQLRGCLSYHTLCRQDSHLIGAVCPERGQAGKGVMDLVSVCLSGAGCVLLGDTLPEESFLIMLSAYLSHGSLSLLSIISGFRIIAVCIHAIVAYYKTCMSQCSRNYII